jgi:hypothetical protein
MVNGVKDFSQVRVGSIYLTLHIKRLTDILHKSAQVRINRSPWQKAMLYIRYELFSVIQNNTVKHSFQDLRKIAK